MLSFLFKVFSWCCVSKPPQNESYDPLVASEEHGILIGAFNCNNFGKSKFNKEDIVNHYYKILSRYHLILLQEVQDKNLQFVPDFVDGLNRYTGLSYKYKISECLGRKSRKEQYLYLYRDSVFTHVDDYLYDDGSEENGDDTFERQPFVIKFRSRRTKVKEFAVIGVHLFYKSVEQELNELYNVYEDLVHRWGPTIPVLIMGDFLAGGQYLPKTKHDKCKLKQDEKFHWIIENTDTTVSKNEYTYDRIIVVGNELLESIVEDSPTAFHFDDVFGLDMDKAKLVSDHYPVEFRMRMKHTDDERNIIEKDEHIGDKDIDVVDIIPKIQTLGIADHDDEKRTNRRIGSFNVRRFSSKKMKDPFVRNQLYKILNRYDLVLIQEVQVKEDLECIQHFVNQLRSATGKDYGYVATELLGRKRYKEQYLYIYRKDLFELVDHFTYDDGPEEEETDTFSREPFVVLLHCSKCLVKQFAIIGCHIAPKSVQQEMEELVNVYEEVRAKWGDDCPVILMGDFNADGSYLSKKKKHSLTLWKDESYHWLLDNVDTTVAKSDNNYDRIIVNSEELFRNIKSSGVYRFDSELGLSEEEAQRISDHYPVEFLIDDKHHGEL